MLKAQACQSQIKISWATIQTGKNILICATICLYKFIFILTLSLHHFSLEHTAPVHCFSCIILFIQKVIAYSSYESIYLTCSNFNSYNLLLIIILTYTLYIILCNHEYMLLSLVLSLIYVSHAYQSINISLPPRFQWQAQEFRDQRQ